MKRGLKVLSASLLAAYWISYNRYPDEKGTERFQCVLMFAFQADVTTVSPMKRGLKDDDGGIGEGGSVVTTVTPMKRGLKARARLRLMWAWGCYNRFPDEKGTESTGATPAYVGWGCYNRFPDEKGTESCNGRSDLRIATRYSKPFMVDFRIT